MVMIGLIKLLSPKKLVRLTIFFLLAGFLFWACSSSAPRPIPEAPVRFIDLLQEENIVSSPFINIEDHFQPFREEHQNEALFIPELSTSEIKCWSIMTERPVLTLGKTQKPYSLQVKLNQTVLPELEEEKGDDISWQLIKIAKKIDLSADDNYNKVFRCVVLDLDEELSFEFLAPAAPFKLFIKARRNWHPSFMQIFIDQQPVTEIELSRTNHFFTIDLNLPPGSHHLTVKPLIKGTQRSGGPTPPRILIYEVKLDSTHDLINFYVPAHRQEEFQRGLIQLEYISPLLEDGRLNPFAPLLELKHAEVINAQLQPINPEKIKKKINFGDRTIDVLMSPPESRYEFELSLPQKAVLEFGYGLLVEEDSVPPPNGAALFQVILQNKKSEQTIFQASLPRKEQDSPFFQKEKIDLSAYQGQKVKITLVTTASENQSSTHNIFSFWFNPLIYVPRKEAPKVILVSLDTLRADHLGCYGYSRETSPYLDALSRESVLFENVYAQSSWTLPSHTSMLFSLNSASHQVYYNDQRIDPSLPSLASLLQKAGFLPYAFTGGGYVSSIYGFAKGFHWYEEPAGGRHAPLARDEAERLANYASQWIKANQDKPFFLFLHTFQIHGPYDTPPPWNKKFLHENAKWTRIALRKYLESWEKEPNFTPEEIQNIIDLYDAEIFYTDATLIKNLIETLKSTGIFDQTMLIVTSDHGEEFYEHHGWLHGQTLYEEQLRVPLIIKFPHSRYKGHRLQPKVRLIDILPTIMETLRLSYPAKSFEGRSLLPVIEGRETSDRVFISDLALKEVKNPCPALMATNQGDMKVIVEKAVDTIKNMEIYNLAQDPHEHKNLLRSQRQLGLKLYRRLEKYYREKLAVLRETKKVFLDEKLREKLRALGYIK